ncbi:MAG TPA: hypothetical protein EYF95_07300 [Flavobacteriales bacterium]|nr:hypothetical protein [Flavobacteriales bacterium]
MENNTRKKIIASSAAYILGMQPKVEIEGTPKQIKRFKEALDASKDLYCILQEGNNQEVHQKLLNKKNTAKRFYDEFGWQWPF